MNSLTLSTGFTYRILALSGALLLTACASQVPALIKDAPPEDLSLARAQHDAEKHQGKAVRWGGTIITTQNQQDKTEVTILAKPLDSRGEPREGDHSYGRFIALVNGFLDPAIYAPGRSVTVYGKYEKLLPKKIDNFDYNYPVIAVSQLYLWDVPPKYDYYDNPYWYDPWYPWSPYYGPYRHRR